LQQSKLVQSTEHHIPEVLYHHYDTYCALEKEKSLQTGSYRNIEVSTVVWLWAQLFWEMMWCDISTKQCSKERIIDLKLQYSMKSNALPCDEISKNKNSHREMPNITNQ
jgi:hypothetical protein